MALNLTLHDYFKQLIFLTFKLIFDFIVLSTNFFPLESFQSNQIKIHTKMKKLS